MCPAFLPATPKRLNTPAIRPKLVLSFFRELGYPRAVLPKSCEEEQARVRCGEGVLFNEGLDFVCAFASEDRSAEDVCLELGHRRASLNVSSVEAFAEFLRPLCSELLPFEPRLRCLLRKSVQKQFLKRPHAHREVKELAAASEGF